MATMNPMEYARKYWRLEVPILNDDNEVVRNETIDFNKYRMHQGWGQSPPIFPPGQMEFVNAVNNYSYNLYRQGKTLRVMVRNIWDATTILTPQNHGDSLYNKILERAAMAFSGKGSPEDVQLTLQLAARSGVAIGGLQRYCDEKVDSYARLGLDCNGFVGNYLCYRDSAFSWNYSTLNTKPAIHGNMLIGPICTQLASKSVSDVNEMLLPRVYVLALVNGAGAVVDGGWGPMVGHIMITQAHHWGFYDVHPPLPKAYLGKKCLLYSGVEATPDVGLTDFKYTILDIDKHSGVATVWRDKAFGNIAVKIYPVP